MIEQLRRFDIFNGMGQDELEQIAEACGVRKIDKGSILFTSGDSAEFLFLVTKGAIDLCCNVNYQHAETYVCIDHISEGEAFGWSVLTYPFRYHLTAQVVEDSELIEIKQDALKRICEADTKTGFHLMNNIAQIIGRRFGAMQSIVRDMIQQSLKEKESMT